MSTYETRSRAGSDGKVILTVPPEFANTDIRITVEPIGAGAEGRGGAGMGRGGVAAGNGAPVPPRRELTPEEWHALIDRMAGSIPDFPDVERPGPDAYERRDG